MVTLRTQWDNDGNTPGSTKPETYYVLSKRSLMPLTASEMVKGKTQWKWKKELLRNTYSLHFCLMEFLHFFFYLLACAHSTQYKSALFWLNILLWKLSSLHACFLDTLWTHMQKVHILLLCYNQLLVSYVYILFFQLRSEQLNWDSSYVSFANPIKIVLFFHPTVGIQ